MSDTPQHQSTQPPSPRSSARASRGIMRTTTSGTAPFDWNARRPVGRGETWAVFCAAVVLGFFATLVCLAKGYLLLYGDAVAHLAIARRILDAHWPGLSQLGGVWLPLPHLLMLPFVQKMSWWQSGLGGAPMSVLSFAACCAGMWKLARRLVSARWALVAVAIIALNANLLYLASTAMTEALFLALLVWSAVACVECGVALAAASARSAKRWMLGAGLLVFAMVFTRYDGWVIGAAMCIGLACAWWRSPLRRELRWVFAGFTLLCVAGPLLWFGYNAKFEGDWLDFMRGPYSAAAIERRTAPPGQHYRGWHNPAWAVLFYIRTAVADAAWKESGWALAAAAVWGLVRSFVLSSEQRVSNAVRSASREASTGTNRIARSAPGAAANALPQSPAIRWGALLLWLPLPFYIYAVAYGSVPIFIPQLWPHAFYNARYGMEMLPAFALYTAITLHAIESALRPSERAWFRIAVRLLQPAAMLLCTANLLAMMYAVPLVLKEGMVNAVTRVAFERELAAVMDSMPPDATVMMYTSAHVGAVQVAGRTLRSMVSEMDNDAWVKALQDPAASAAFVIAIAGDPVDAAVHAHPGGLTELDVVCTTGQPCARIYRSDVRK